MEKKAKEFCTKMAGAHPRPEFSVAEQVIIVLKCTETNSVLQTTRCFQSQFSNQRTVQTNMNGQVYAHLCQDGLRLNKNIGNRGCQRTIRTEAKRWKQTP